MGGREGQAAAGAAPGCRRRRCRGAGMGGGQEQAAAGAAPGGRGDSKGGHGREEEAATWY